MLICEASLKRAIESFLKEARIPRPEGWSSTIDSVYIEKVIVPAFYHALSEIEEVHPCYGFDLKSIKINRE